MDARVQVVIADDDDDIRLLMEIAVRKAGMDLVGAVADGPSALETIRRTIPSLVVLDVSMPGLTGLDVCAAVRSDPRCAGMKILVLSAGVDRLHSLADSPAEP
jgi:CheY-like chemotaxis protein